MKRIDARKQTREALHERRQQVIRLHEEGVPVMQIVARSGLSWSAVNSAIKRYQAQGESALMPSARGRKQGSGRTLTADQEARVRDLVRLRRPWFFRLKKSLWDRAAVKQLIEQEYAINLSTRVVGNYLDRWGLTLKKSKRRGQGSCTRDIRAWLDLSYADILRQSREEDAEIYWLSEVKAIDTDLWCPEETPPESLPEASPTEQTETVEATDADLWCPEETPPESLPDASPTEQIEKKLLMASVVTNQGKVCWAISNGAFNAERQIKFMEALVRDTRRKKLFLIRTNWTDYRSPNFERWVGLNKHRIKIFPKSRDALG
jgi:transposase